MIRMQIRLEACEHQRAKEQARLLGITVAEFVRRAVREALPPTGRGAWMRFAGMVESGNRHSSQSVDEFAYSARD